MEPARADLAAVIEDGVDGCEVFTRSTPGVNDIGVRSAYPPAVMKMATGDVTQMTLALVEAHVGSLVDYLPVALLIADGNGAILRANRAAVELFECRGALVGRQVVDVLAEQEFDVRLRLLCHDDDVLRLYVIHESIR